ncbi:MAG: hypothetical protein KJ896_02925, partial [Nanoarchaeota archaeon]|nr:hypothetical protein [Nanoarchaeota archaeon]
MAKGEIKIENLDSSKTEERAEIKDQVVKNDIFDDEDYSVNDDSVENEEVSVQQESSTTESKLNAHESIKINKIKVDRVKVSGSDDNSQRSDDDLGFDFSNIKNKFSNLFSKNKKKENNKYKSLSKENKKEDDELNLDLSKAKTFFKSNAKWIIPIALILIAIIFSTYFRIMPAYLPITDDWAEDTVYNFYMGNIANQISQQYPNLPDANKQTLMNEEFEKQLKENSDQINAEIAQISQQYKSQMQDDDGQTYLLAIDPYYWYNFAKWRIENGHWGNALNSGQEWSYSYGGRDGRAMHFELPSFVIIILFSFWSLFSNISIMKASFYLPVIIVGLSLIPAFFIGKKIKGNIGGFFAAIIVAINSALLSRTPAGFSDTDAYQALFPLLICWLFLESFEAKTLMKRIILSISLGLLIGIYILAWQGGGFILTIISAAAILAIIIKLLLSKFVTKEKLFSSIKSYSISFGIFFLSAALSMFLLVRQNAFKGVINVVLGTINLKDVATISIWPNVLTTVAEFNVIPIMEIVPQMGGKLLFAIALIGIIGLIFNSYNKKESILYPVLLIVWMIATAYGFTRGMRFAILMVPAFALAFGSGCGLIYNYVNGLLHKNIHIGKNLSSFIVIILICLTLISPMMTANVTAKNDIPSMNDAWYNTLTKIQENTSDAI